MDLVNKIKQFKKTGIEIFPDVLDKKTCKNYVSELEKILELRKTKGEYVGDQSNLVLYNFFEENLNLSSLITLPVIDKIMENLIDGDYVLISNQAKNRMNSQHFNISNKSNGIGWHTDGRFVGNNQLKPSLCYTVIIALEDFTEHNGSTRYISKSHKKNYRPERNKNYGFSTLEMSAGSIAIMDTSLWHTAGPPGKESRWSVFNMYGPWFVKPYFRYYDMFEEKKIMKFSRLLHKLLHFGSNPPLNQNERLATLKRVGL